MPNSEFGIIIRNITNDSTGDSNIRDSLHYLFNNRMDISTPLDCISIFIDKTKQRYARIYVKSDTDVKKALNILKDRGSRNQINFCFLSIADETVDIVASGILPKKYYGLDKELGPETRKKAFITGGDDEYMKQECSRNDISKYMCGFLNSQVEGTLYIGVTEKDDKGVVCGVPISEMSKDMVRRTYIDKAAEDTEPSVHPNLYSVKLVPIEYKGALKAGWFVIKIHVKKMKEKTKTPYVTKPEEVYWRDSETHKLTSGNVQDWFNQKPTSKSCAIL